MNFIRTSFVIIMLLACAAAQSVADRGQPQQPSFQASVSPGKARFVVPISHRDSWEWHQDDTKDNRQEYRIAVTVHNNNENYSFGFYMFKRPGSNPKRGDLTALVKAGQQNLFISQPDGRYSLVKDAEITVRPEKDSLIISVEGKQNIDRLFSSRPEKVRFTIAVLKEPEISKSVVVAYADR